MGYDYDELYPGRFLKSGQFKGRDVTLTIRAVEIEKLPDQKRGERVRGIVSFEKTPLQLVLNRTNGECLKGMFGRRTEDWVGKRVTFFPATVEAFGEPTLAIRVRGSPDIDRDRNIQINVGGKVRKVTMQCTNREKAKAPAAKQQKAGPPRAPVEEPAEEAEQDLLPGHAVAGPETVPPPPDDFGDDLPFDSETDAGV